jgi:hypothetical protein
MMIKYIHVRNSIKLEVIKLSINIWIIARKIEKLKRHDYGLNRALDKVLATHNLDENHPHKKITRKKRKTRENPSWSSLWSFPKLVCLSSMFRGLFIEIRRTLEALENLEKLEVSLKVQIGDWKSNPRRKRISNSFRFLVLYCGVIWHSKCPNWKKFISNIFFSFLISCPTPLISLQFDTWAKSYG